MVDNQRCLSWDSTWEDIYIMTTPNQPEQQPSGDQGQQPSGDQGQQPQSTPQGGQQPTPETPKFTQKQYNDFEAKVRREYEQKAARDKELIEKGKRLEQHEQEQQPISEQLQRVSAESAQKDSTIASKDLQITRLNLAWESGLPPAIGRRVQGNTEDEIRADIESIKADMAASGAAVGQGGGLRPNPQQGAPSPNGGNRTGSVSAGRDLWGTRHGKKEDAAT